MDILNQDNNNMNENRTPRRSLDSGLPSEMQKNAQTEIEVNKPREKRTSLQWIKKYFFEGQALRIIEKDTDPSTPLLTKLVTQYRRIVGIAIPFVVVHAIWWSCAMKYDYWSLFPERYFMTITMIFGSLIAGMTSEGGASVAFPVMTLAFGIKPAVARDFSLMIQSVGMTAASFTILWMQVVIEWHSIAFCSCGALFGIIIGLQYIDPNLTPPQKKLGFVSVWFSFAFSLFLLNRHYKRRTFKIIPDFTAWKACVLLLTGFVGGVFSAISGSGVDICSFSVLTLLFRVTEKTATPTSVVLMGINTVVGFYWRQVMMQAVNTEAYYYLVVCVPVVVIGAPLGSIIGSHFHRQVLASFVYITDTVALVTAFAIVPLTAYLIGSSVGIILFGFSFFGFLSYAGQRVMRGIPADEDEDEVNDNEALLTVSEVKQTNV